MTTSMVMTKMMTTVLFTGGVPEMHSKEVCPHSGGNDVMFR